MGILADQINALDRLEEQYKREKERIEQAIADTVRSVGQNPAVRPIGKKHVHDSHVRTDKRPLVSGISRLDDSSGTPVGRTEQKTGQRLADIHKGTARQELR